MPTFEKKTVLITAGTSGIGKASALAFAKEGANVVVSGLRVAEGEQVAREITSTGGRGLFVQTDVIREDESSPSSKRPSQPSAGCTSRSITLASRANSAC
jgi:NAD(P)-dependent dehydrogenase (short-subunit alcohol dehydrogenase family)